MDATYHSFILHRRDFRDSSLIVDFFTQEEGLISAVAKGAKRPKSNLRNHLQYFTPLIITCYGRSELLGLKSVETDAAIIFLNGNYLLSMLYVNELLIKLLHKHVAYPEIYKAYQQLIQKMTMAQAIEPCLRTFEMTLLMGLGYELHFEHDALDNRVIEEVSYTFCLNDGLTQLLPSKTNKNSYSGLILKKIQQKQFDDKVILTTAKKLFRDIFSQLLQHKKINSRVLFSHKKTKGSLEILRV